MTATSTTTDTISPELREWLTDYALRMSAQDEGGEES